MVKCFGTMVVIEHGYCEASQLEPVFVLGSESLAHPRTKAYLDIDSLSAWIGQQVTLKAVHSAQVSHYLQQCDEQDVVESL